MSLKQKITQMNFFAWLFVSCVLFESIEGDSKELKFHKKKKEKRKEKKNSAREVLAALFHFLLVPGIDLQILRLIFSTNLKT